MTTRSDASIPALNDQERYWDLWNRESRFAKLDPYTARLRDVAVHWVSKSGEHQRILEVGCGAGWMSAALATVGNVVGVDLSPDAIEVAKMRCPQADFICGDFYTLDLPGDFDAVVTSDTIAHVPDQPGFIDRIGQLLAPGGTLVLMSQNSYALKRSSWVKPPAPGQIRRWPTIPELRSMLARDFEVEHVTTAAPRGATSGVFRVLNARRVWNGLCAAIGEPRVIAIYERLWLGSELVIIARRR